MSNHNPVEHATARGRNTFPAMWGQPPGTQHSEARAAWVREMVAKHGPVTALRKLDAANARLLAILRMASLDARKDGP